MPSVQFIPATLEHYDALYNLAQLYQYDFSEFLPGEVDGNGQYPYIDVRRYLTHRGHKAYLARSNGYWCGFVLVSDHLHRRRGGDGRYLAEFFVMRRYRRQGIGRELAFKTFDTYRGYWEVAEVGSNGPAQTFWRKVIGEYTRGRYEEKTINEDGMPIIWQTFDSGKQ